MTPLLDWAQDKDAICEQIAGNRVPLKLVLKTHDEVDFLPRWIEHHRQIVGLRGLVIFDNHSTEPAIQRIYREIRDEATVVSFPGYHNDLHKPAKFGELYEALQASADYFAMLDTDERLIWLKDGEHYVRDASMLDDLRSRRGEAAIPGIWLANVSGYDDRFHLYDGGVGSPIGTRLGKPLFSSRASLSERVCHNFQANKQLFRNVKEAKLIVLHLKNLSPRQRVRINLQKLRQYNVLGDNEGLETVLELDPTDMAPSNPRTWIGEIHRLSHLPEYDRAQDRRLSSGHIKFELDGTISFYDNDQKQRFQRFQRDAYPTFARVLELGQP